jgi:hypothetical protein
MPLAGVVPKAGSREANSPVAHLTAVARATAPVPARPADRARNRRRR